LKKINPYIIYESINEGDGETIGEEDKISVVYTIKTSSGYLLYTSEHIPEEIELNRTISGIKIGLGRLKVGSKGILYIHPNYGFRDKTLLPAIKPYLIVEFNIISKIY